MLSAQKFLSMSDPESMEGRLYCYSGELKEIGELDCPALAIFGSNTEYQEKPGEKLEILKRKMKRCDTKMFEGANHGFVNKETELVRLVSNWTLSH